MTIVNRMDVTKADAELITGMLSDVPWNIAAPEMRMDALNILAKLVKLPFGGKYKERVRKLTKLVRESGPAERAKPIKVKWEPNHRVVWDVWDEDDEHDEGTILEVRTTRGGLVLCDVRWDIARDTTMNMQAAKLKPKLCSCGQPLKLCPSGEVCENGHGQ